MEKQKVFGFGTVLLLAVLNSAQAEVQPSYFVLGGKLDLRPSVSEALVDILWKHNGDLVAEWVKDTFDKIYGKFDGRTTLDTTTGRLEIKGMTEADAGVYTVKINKKVQSLEYNATAIKEVPQPSVWIRPVACGPASDNCTLTCAGETTGAEPVTYSLRKDDGEWEQSEKDVVITKTETARVKTFSCRIKNPVSHNESKPEPNPLYTEDGPIHHIVAALVSVAVIAVALVAVLGYMKRDQLRRCVEGGGDSSGAAGARSNGSPSSPEGRAESGEMEHLKSPEEKTGD